MAQNQDTFDDIRAYRDEDVPAAIKRMFSDPLLKRTIGKALPWVPYSLVVRMGKRYSTVRKFQHKIAIRAIKLIAMPKIKKLSYKGFEQTDPTKGYVYMTNHRDIVLDSTFLQMVMYYQQKETTEIGIGNNLLIHPWIEELVRINKAFVVKRGLPLRETLLASKKLSGYLRYTLEQERQSVWIAQREGRCKDSDDKTQESVLKMLAMEGDDPFIEKIRRCNIIPVSISYQYDPCDYLKAQEFQQKRDYPSFKKSPDDDLKSMATGITTYKGLVHYQAGRPLNQLLDQVEDLPVNQQATAIARIIDSEIYANYRFYPQNYIAYDLLQDVPSMLSHYTVKERVAFENYLHQQIEKVEITDKDTLYLKEMLLKMYANPLINHLKNI